MNNEKKDRAARVVAYLERRTVANGCTPAEEASARAKAEEVRAKYGLETAQRFDGADVLDVDLGIAFATLADLMATAILEAEARKRNLRGFARTKRHSRVFTFKF